MNLKVSESMAQGMADLEDGCSVTAGRLDAEPFSHEAAERTAGPAKKEAYLAILGRLINMARRSAGLTLEQLAERADIDAREIFLIEEEAGAAPEPQVVSRLARALSLPTGKLHQLAGHVTVLDPGVSTAAYRFAARSASVQPLSADQEAALNEFVEALAEA